MAPRDWACLGLLGSDGSTLLVTPEPFDTLSRPLSGPAVVLDRVSGGTSGRFEVAKIVARVFPEYTAFVQRVTNLFEFFEPQVVYGPYLTDTLTYRWGTRTVEYRTPPNSQGLGTSTSRLGENGDPIDGVAMVEGEIPELLFLSIRLPSELRVLAPLIIADLERAEGNDPR